MVGAKACVLLLSSLLASTAGQTQTAAPGHGYFATSLSGLGGRPIGETPTSSTAASVLMQQSLEDTDPLAVCNDGSPASFYYQPGTAAGASLWLVYLEGSMFCWSEESCQERNLTLPWFTSSTQWSDSFAQGGIFDPDPESSSFATANRIYVKYCSSDLWAGDVAASAATWGFAFRGARIVPAVITALATRFGMGSSPGHVLLFGGCSAGAIGAMNNLDAVAMQAAGYGVTTYGFLDAAALVDIDPAGWPWSRDLIPLQTLMSWLVGLLQPSFPPACTAAGYVGILAWKCLWSSYRMPLLTTPFFANAVQYDDFLIQYTTDNLAPHDAQQVGFIDSFQTAYLALINRLPSGTGVYSPTCLVHCLSGQATYYNFYITSAASGQNVTMSQALDSWFFDKQPTSVISGCTGWDCTRQCGVEAWGAAIPCNMGSHGCEAVSLPTSEPDEHAPATENAVQVLPGTPAPPGGAAVLLLPPPESGWRATEDGGGVWVNAKLPPPSGAGGSGGGSTGSVSSVESLFTELQQARFSRLVHGGGSGAGSDGGAGTSDAGGEGAANAEGPTAAAAPASGAGPAPTDGGETTDFANTGSRA